MQLVWRVFSSIYRFGFHEKHIQNMLILGLISESNSAL